ncbi:MAG: glycoside hydrolase family 30 protein [Clostridia bacterium]|nr:glycoside hydrolase family 30 protein [Clostridia bacterium]
MKNSIIKASSRIITAILSFIISCLGVIGVNLNREWPVSETVESNVNTGNTVIDTDAQYQTLRGFGASACWWGKDVGTWDNAEDVLALLYDDQKGIGLNIFRYNLGAGSVGDENMYVEYNRTESFLKEDGTLDFTADAAAQNTLAIAKEIAGDDLRVCLFANSPPVSLTKNGKAYSAPVKNDSAPYECNIAPENFEAYADYLYACAEYFLEKGYRVVDISAMNEPQYAWRAWYNADGSFSCNQEGCHYEPQDALELLQVLIDKFDRSKVDKLGCKVSMFESGEIQGQWSVPANYIDFLLGVNKDDFFYNRNIRNYFDTISTHSYWSSAETKQQAADYLNANYSNYDIACTEYCQMLNDWNTGVHDYFEQHGATNGLGIDFGLAMANVIMDDLTILNAVEWNWWTGCSYGVYTDGLVYLDRNDHTNLTTSKRLWCLGNFSKFIDEGAVRIACSSGVDALRSAAFVNPDGETIIVYLNGTDSALTTVLPDITENGYTVHVTDATRDLEQIEMTGKQIEIPAKSVVTVVVDSESGNIFDTVC